MLANYVTVVEDIMSAEYCIIPVPVLHFWPKLTLERGLSAIAELLVSTSHEGLCNTVLHLSAMVKL